MSEHHITLEWKRTTPGFEYATYNRSHTATFKNNKPLKMSASVDYKGDADMVDPEETLVAALSSCHMLSFLAIACKRKFAVASYVDEAVGVLEKNAEGNLAITRVTLRPQVTFSGPGPDAATLQKLHDDAHHACFIANSVKTDVTVEVVEAAMSR